MPCEEEQQAVDSLSLAVTSLQASLDSATPAEKPGIITEIKNTEAELNAARKKLTECQEAHPPPAPQDIPVDIDIELRYSGPVVGDKTDHDHFNLVMTLQGPAEARAVTLTSFTIQRAATTEVTPGQGVYYPPSRSMSLPGHVKVSFGDLSAENDVILTTGSVSLPSGKFSGSGAPFDASTMQLTLVGGGAVSISIGLGDLTFEYFVTARCTLATVPT